MNKEEIISRVRDELGDNGIDYYSSDDLGDCFNDGYQEVAVITGCIERMFELSLVDNQVYYNLYEAYNGYLRTFAIWNPTINDWMSHKDVQYFHSVRRDWERANGSSYHFSVIDFQYIAVFPHLSTATDDNWEVFCKAVPVLELENHETPEIPEQYQVVLHYYMMADLLSQSEEFTKSSLYEQAYIQKVNEFKTYVNTRSFPDRVNILRAQFSGGSFYGR